MLLDEPIYRRFYRVINDNFIYPYSMYLKENKLDRINVDRKFDINPIVQKRYKIYEKYVPNGNLFDELYKILSTITGKGHILIFSTGKKGIMEEVNEINDGHRFSAFNVIAIPWFGKLDKDIIQFYQEVTDGKKSFTIDKHKIKYIEQLNDNMLDKGNNKYDRVIYIATNIAESSITINDLLYVIDDGKRNISKYDYTINNSVLKEVYITETNRLQRRGRVGRISDGYVIYLYDKNKLNGVRPEYKICQEDLTEIFLHLFMSHDDCNYLFDDSNDPLNLLYTDKFNTFKHSNEDIEKIFIKSFKKLNYFGDNKMYDYEGNKQIVKFSITGYTIDSIQDKLCNFYIIHPNESSFIRDIFGRPIKVVDENDEISIKDYKLNSNKIYQTLKKLYHDKLFEGINGKFCKTQLADFVTELIRCLPGFSENLNIKPYNISLIIINSYKFGLEDIIYKLFSMLFATGNDITNMIRKEEIKIRGITVQGKLYNNFYKLHCSKYDSEILSIVNAIFLFETMIDHIYIDLESDETKLFLKKILNQLDIFSYNEGIVKKDEIGMYVYKNLINNNNIEEVSNKLFFDSRTINDYLIHYSNFNRVKYIIKNNLLRNDYSKLLVRNFETNIKNLHELFSMVFNKNIIKKIGSSLYVNIYSPIETNLIQLNRKLLMNPIHTKNYLTYISISLNTCYIIFLREVPLFKKGFVNKYLIDVEIFNKRKIKKDELKDKYKDDRNKEIIYNDILHFRTNKRSIIYCINSDLMSQ